MKDVVNANTEFRFGKPYSVLYDSWFKEHIDDVNKAFGRDMSKCVMEVYDSPDDVEKEFKEDFYVGSDIFKPVLDKWVGVIA